MKYKFTLCFILISVLIAGIQALACWIAVAPEVYAQDCPIIISGKIIKTDETISDALDGYDMAYIKVRKIFKNTLKEIELQEGKSFAVRMAPIRKNSGVSTDIRYAAGKDGIWLISMYEKERFSIASHPVQYQPLNNEKELNRKGAFIIEQVTLEDGNKTTRLFTMDEWITHVKTKWEKSRKAKNQNR